MFALCTQVTFYVSTLDEMGTSSKTRATNYLAVVLERKVECESADTLRLCTRGHLQALDDTGVALVLEARVLALRVLTDDRKVDVLVARGEARERLAEDD